MPTIIPHLWYDDQAEEAARWYVSIFPNSRIVEVARYPEAAEAVSGKPAGSVMTVVFELDRQRFFALNGGPQFTFNESVSFMVMCDGQPEVDHYWSRLTEGGEEGPCGWLKDRFGLSWQVVPRKMEELLRGDAQAVERVTAAFLKMKKLDIAALERAYAG